MKEERIAQKWRLVKLSRSRPLLVFRLVTILSDKFGEEVYKVAFDYGREKGEEIARNLRVRGFVEVSKFISMITGAKLEQKEGEAIFLSCPVNALEQIKSSKICKGYIEGFFSAFGIKVEAFPDCRDQCKILVRQILP